MRSHIVVAQLEYVLAFNDTDHRELLVISYQRGLGLRRCRACVRVRPCRSDDGCALAVPDSTIDLYHMTFERSLAVVCELPRCQRDIRVCHSHTGKSVHRASILSPDIAI